MTATAKPLQTLGADHRPAGIVTRGAAAAVDLAVVLLAWVVVFFTVVGARLVWSPTTFSWPEAPFWAFITFEMVVSVVYLTVSWATAGRTYGNLLLGLRVLMNSRRKLGWAHSFVRAGFCVFFPVGLFWVVLSPQRRSIQDVVLRTTVVYDWRRAEKIVLA